MFSNFVEISQQKDFLEIRHAFLQEYLRKKMSKELKHDDVLRAVMR